MQRQMRGTTLIELMITVAIIGILAAVAYPSYQSYLIRGNRAEAQAFMMDAAQRQQQYLLDNRSYAADFTALNVSVPSHVSSYYTLQISALAGPPPTFTITATPVTGSTQASDGALTINHAGAKTPASSW